MGLGSPETSDMASFLLDNWGELLLGVMAFVKLIVNITPTDTDNRIFGYLDSLINMIVADRIRKTGSEA